MANGDGVNPHDTTSYGQQQDSQLQLTKATGDIRDLYAYYRFSDHQLTNVVLKEKVHKRESVWFEGYMDWTFKECLFKESFYFGVEGARLPEDSRETETNPEPFPGYGSNGLHFESCKFEKTFEIRDNCNVMFKGCNFKEEVSSFTIGDNCRVEFINCNFECAVNFESFCDVKFRDCDFEKTDTVYVSAKDHCKLHFHNCEMDNPPGTIWMTLENDCSLVVHGGDNLPSWLGKMGTLSLADNCHAKVYKMEKVCTQQGYVFSLTNGSKVEVFDVEEISCPTGICFQVGNGEAYVRNSKLVRTGQGTTISLDDGVFRSDNVEEILCGQGNVVSASNGSKALIRNSVSVTTGQGNTLQGVDSSFELADVTTVSTGEGITVLGEGTGRSYFRRVEEITSGTGPAIDLSNSYEVYCFSVSSITAGTEEAIVLDNARFELLDGATISGSKDGIAGSYANVRVTNLATITSDEDNGLNLTNSVYDLRDVQTISGKKAGAVLTNCRGIFVNIGTFSGQDDYGISVVNCSGPTEWSGITTITSQSGDAFSATGNLSQFRIVDIGSITSASGDAAFVSISSGKLDLKTIDNITALNNGLTINGQGEVYGDGLFAITSQQGTAFGITMSSNGKGWFRNLGAVTSQEGTAASLTTSDNGEIGLWTVTSPFSSQEGDAMVITSSGDSYVSLRSIAGMTSQEGRPLVVTASGTSEVYIHSIMAECTTEENVAWTLTLSGQSQVTVRETAGASSEQGQAVSLNVGTGSTLILDDNTKFSSTEEIAVSGTVQGTLKVNNMDEISTEQGRMIVLGGGSVPESWVEFTNIGSITGTNPSEDGVAVTQAGTIRFVDIDEVTVENSSRYVMNFSSLGPELGKIELIDIASVEGTTCRGGVTITECGDAQFYCTDAKGTVTCETATTHCVSVLNGNLLVRNFSEIKNGDDQANGIYSNNAGRVILENIDLIQGERGVYLNATKEISISNCPSIKAPNSGQAGTDIYGNARVTIHGSSPTVIEAKDANTTALKLNGGEEIRNDFRLFYVQVPASKGKIEVSNLAPYFHGCQFDGSTSFSQCSGEVQRTTMTVGLAITDSTLNFYDTKIQLGTNSGPDQNLTIISSTVNAYRCEVTGDKEVNFDGSVVDFTWTTTALAGGTWTTTDSVLRGVKADWTDDINATATSVVQLVKTTHAGNVIIGNDQVVDGHLVTLNGLTIGSGSSATMSKLTANGTTSIGTDAAFELNKGTLTAISLGQGSGNILNRVVQGQTNLLTDVGLIMNWVDSGVFTTQGDAAIIANNYTTDDRFTLNSYSAAVMVECDTAQTDFNQYSGVIIAGCDTRTMAVDLNVGIVAADWECSYGNIVTGSGCGIVGARMRTATEWRLGQDNGIISAVGSGAWNTSASGIGAVFAKHDTDLTAAGSRVGIIGASMAHDLTLEGGSSGIVVASQEGTSDATGVVAAYSDEVTGAGVVMASGGAISSSDGLVAAGCGDIGSGGNGCIASGGAGDPNAKGTIAAGGGYTSVYGANGVAVVGPTSCSTLSAGEDGGLIALGKQYSAITTPSKGGAFLAGTEIDLTVGSESGLMLAGCKVPSGLSVASDVGVIGATVISTGDHTVTGDAILISNKQSSGDGRAITMTPLTSFLSTSSSQKYAIRFTAWSLGLYNKGGASWDPTSGSASGDGTSMVLGCAAVGPLSSSSELQTRASGTNILDISPTIHHNLYPIEM